MASEGRVTSRRPNVMPVEPPPSRLTASCAPKASMMAALSLKLAPTVNGNEEQFTAGCDAGGDTRIAALAEAVVELRVLRVNEAFSERRDLLPSVAHEPQAAVDDARSAFEPRTVAGDADGIARLRVSAQPVGAFAGPSERTEPSGGTVPPRPSRSALTRPEAWSTASAPSSGSVEAPKMGVNWISSVSSVQVKSCLGVCVGASSSPPQPRIRPGLRFLPSTMRSAPSEDVAWMASESAATCTTHGPVVLPPSSPV